MMVPTRDECMADEPTVLCIVRDMTNAETQLRFNLNLPASYTGKQLIEGVASRLGYQPESFSLTYEKPVGEELVEIEMSAYLDTRLGEALVNIGNKKRNTFNVMDKDGVAPIKVESKDSGIDAVNLGATASPSTENKDIYTNSSNTWSSWSSPTNYSYGLSVTKSDTGFVGLVNQAMTCYLNSLLQTLYMTPEFRNAVYRWAFDGGSEEMVKKSIPYQLQRLFLMLQTSTKRAMETTDITKSFGWDSSEAWQQHDVQELMRVMFDALEKKWKNTAQADLINKLYQGRMQDYVKCLECGSESARTDCYLDIPLTIRPFGSENSYGSVEESLQAFVQHELLEGGNQYFCEKCNQKCNAHKGLKFQSFPYLLTLQLKRFDFDYSTMHRIKLNDKMTFPQILNLNHLVESQNPEGTDGTATETRGEEGGGERMDSSPSAASAPPPPEPPNSGGDQDEGIDEDMGCSASGGTRLSNSEAAANDRNTRDMGEKGPYVYELYSIMIHSGSAAGGHYYAYIKSFKDGQWYSFNDQHVSTITFDDIKKTFGGSGTRGYYSATYSSSTNAYMLVYRQIDKQRNEEVMAEAAFPEHLQRELYKLQNREEEEQKQKEKDRSTCKIKLYCFHPVLLKQLESKLEVHKDTTLQEATEIAWKKFNLDRVVALDEVRLVKYDEYNDYIECSYEGEEGRTMEEVLDGVKATYIWDLLLEVRKTGASFQKYRTGGITVKVMVCDLEDETIRPPHTIRAYNTQTVGEFRTQVAEELGLPLDTMRCVLEKYSNDLRLLTNSTKTLKAESFFKSHKVFVECSGLENDEESPFADSKFAKMLDRYEHTIRINVSLPPYPNKVKTSAQPRSSNTDASADTKVDIESNNDSDEGFTNSHHDTNGDVIETISTNHIGTQQQQQPPAHNQHQAGSSVTSSLLSTSSSSTSGPLRSSSSAEQQSQMHSFISDSIHKLHTNNGGGGVGIGGVGVVGCSDSLPHHQSVQSLQSEDSESTVTSSLDSNSTVTSCSTVTPSEPNTYTDEDDEHALNSDLLSSKVSSMATSQSMMAAAAAASGASGASSAEMNGDGEEGGQGDYKNGAAKCRNTTTEEESWEDRVDVTQRGEGEGQEAEAAREGEGEESEDEYSRYCRASVNIDAETKDRGLTVYVDKRITIKVLKNILAQYVGAAVDYFKVYKVFSNNQEIECTRSSETLLGFVDDSKLIVKLGRALKVGENRVKIFQLQVNEPEPSKFLTEVIIGGGMTVSEVRKMIVEELKEQCDVVIPIDRCRVRKKTWKTPSTIYLDEQVFEQDIPMLSTLELFVEELVEGPERMTTQTQMSVYVRRWWPEKYEVGRFEEIIISDSLVACLKEEISKLSGIPVEQVEFARSKGTFPCEVSVLEAHTELDWNPNVTVVNAWPLSITDDGCIVYYRDSEEKLAELSEEKKRELQQKENIRLSRYSTYSSKYNIYGRKERALKIYTDDTPTKESPPLPPPYSPIARTYGPVNNTATDSFFNTQVDTISGATGEMGDAELD